MQVTRGVQHLVPAAGHAAHRVGGTAPTAAAGQLDRGDTQDQNLLQFFLNVAEFGMTPQEAVEAANFNSYQMKASFDLHESQPGRLLLNASMPQWASRELALRGYKLEFEQRTSGPINAILVDPRNGSFWGGSSNHGEDYGIGW